MQNILSKDAVTAVVMFSIYYKVGKQFLKKMYQKHLVCSGVLCKCIQNTTQKPYSTDVKNMLDDAAPRVNKNTNNLLQFETCSIKIRSIQSWNIHDS